MFVLVAVDNSASIYVTGTSGAIYKYVTNNYITLFANAPPVASWLTFDPTDTSNNILYAVGTSIGSIISVDQSSTFSQRELSLPNPTGLAFFQQVLYYCDGNAGTVSSVVGFTVTQVVSGLTGPSNLIIDNVGNAYTLSSVGTIQAFKIDGSVVPSDFASATLTGLSPQGLAFDYAFNVYTSTNDFNIWTITSTGSASIFAQLPAQANYLGSNSATAALFAGVNSYPDAGMNIVFQVAQSFYVSYIANAANPSSVLVDGALNIWYATDSSIYMLTPDSSIILVVSGINNPIGLTQSYYQSGIYCASATDGTVLYVNNGGASVAASGYTSITSVTSDYSNIYWSTGELQL